MPHSTISWSRCTASKSSGKFCDAPSIPDAPFPICVHHASELYRFLSNAVDETKRNRSEAVRATGSMLDADRKPSGQTIVYYLRLNDLVKIGRTSNWPQRRLSYPPHAMLLATEHGPDYLEVRRHQQFADLLAEGKEWFSLGPGLIAHINKLRKKAGASPISAM